MKINDSSIFFQSNHSITEKYTSGQTLTVWKDGDRETDKVAGGDDPKGLAVGKLFKGDAVSLTDQGGAREVRRVEVENAPEEVTAMEDLNIRILRAMFERILGKRIRIPHFGEIKELAVQQAAEISDAPVNGEGAAGWGLVYTESSSYYEAEQLEFSAQGVVHAEDGSELQIEVNLNLNREFYTEQEISFALGDALKDPLVVNFSGGAAELTQTKFAFDIDADGIEDQVSFVGSGSGFLALDEDDNGAISDGTELFGAVTGDGFAELSRHDGDRNGWIDESDEIYSRLRIWTKDPQGNDRLFALGEKGIGALYLGNISSPFSITTESNELQGQVRSTGLFLREDGQAGTLQQLDLVV